MEQIVFIFWLNVQDEFESLFWTEIWPFLDSLNHSPNVLLFSFFEPIHTNVMSIFVNNTFPCLHVCDLSHDFMIYTHEHYFHSIF